MLRFLRIRPRKEAPHLTFLQSEIARLKTDQAGKVMVEGHAVDHLCDFMGAVAKIHPMGPNSSVADDLIRVSEAVRFMAHRRHMPFADEAIREVFDRYADYKGKEVTFERLFELAEWMLEGAISMKDGGIPDGPHRWRTLAVWFEDLTLSPDRALSGVAPQRGMPEAWFDALLGTATTKQRRYVAPGILEAALVELPPPFPSYNGQLSDQFCSQLLQVGQMLGTIPWIRDYSEADYREYWNSGRSLFPSHLPEAVA